MDLNLDVLWEILLTLTQQRTAHALHHLICAHPTALQLLRQRPSLLETRITTIEEKIYDHVMAKFDLAAEALAESTIVIDSHSVIQGLRAHMRASLYKNRAKHLAAVAGSVLFDEQEVLRKSTNIPGMDVELRCLIEWRRFRNWFLNDGYTMRADGEGTWSWGEIDGR